MIDYLYYKLYQASLKSSLNDIPAFLASRFNICQCPGNKRFSNED